LPSEALAPGAPTWTGCFPTAEGKPANVPTFIKIKNPSNWTFTISNRITSYGILYQSLFFSFYHKYYTNGAKDSEKSVMIAPASLKIEMQLEVPTLTIHTNISAESHSGILIEQ
jgi:hypothetical protein